jgi:hypothetical protein
MGTKYFALITEYLFSVIRGKVLGARKKQEGGGSCIIRSFTR